MSIRKQVDGWMKGMAHGFQVDRRDDGKGGKGGFIKQEGSR